ncbi:GNAT family N-acetyltransferase [Amycolatopsis jejuensis]|uniref:GNAT family N-acetyltransferase n=1 Tax=Amycolatopsis jejuensis TaxID=330084 RepID=UPI0005267E42|nr:GNAT family N-acetyltransferase [Amycolatopsis jejuensis]
MDLTWRPLSLGDAGALARLYAAAEAVDRTGENHDENDLRQEMSAPLVDLLSASIGGWAGERLVSCAVVVPRDAADVVHQPRVESATDPEFRGGEVADHLAEWFVRTAHRVHERHFPGVPGELHAGAHENERWYAALLDRAGFKHERTFVEMRADLAALPPAPPLPGDLVLMPYEPRFDSWTLDARNAAFAGHWGSTWVSPEVWQHRFGSSKDFRPDLSFLLLPPERDRVVAFVLSSFYAADALATGVRELYVNYVGTRAEARGRGLASALLGHTLAAGRAAGFERSALSVDVDNTHRALAVYERCGYAVAERVHGYVLPLG